MNSLSVLVDDAIDSELTKKIRLRLSPLQDIVEFHVLAQRNFKSNVVTHAFAPIVLIFTKKFFLHPRICNTETTAQHFVAMMHEIHEHCIPGADLGTSPVALFYENKKYPKIKFNFEQYWTKEQFANATRCYVAQMNKLSVVKTGKLHRLLKENANIETLLNVGYDTTAEEIFAM